MKLAIASDIHLEFGHIDLYNTESADVLVLAGDILNWPPKPKSEYFFQNCSEQFKNVIYVLGNHEHYDGDFDETYSTLKKFLEPYPNVHLLEKEKLVIDDTLFFGGTFWTNMNNRNPVTMIKVGRGMNDFNYIDNLTPAVAADEFDKTIDALKEALTDEYKVVVVAHHAPSAGSIHPMYKGDRLNYGYYSDLDYFIMDHPEIKLWVHGHVHSSWDYDIGDTRVVCNPRGYITHEPRAATWQLKYVEV